MRSRQAAAPRTFRTRLLASCALCACTLAVRAEPPAVPISWTWSTVTPQPGAPRGLVQFERACAVCHGSGPAKPGTRALRTKYQGKEPALLAERTDLAGDYIRTIARQGISVMPPFRKTELSDADLQAIVAYLTRTHP
jgi:mono/diheme cytochrome c family protein